MNVKCDAIFTSLKNVTLTVKPGDCTTAVIYVQNKDGDMLGLIHSGWRGVNFELPRKAIEYLLTKLNCNPESIYLGITPHIHWDYRTHEFMPDFFNKDGWGDLAVFKNDLWYLNENGYAIKQYLSAGVIPNHIENYEIDTYTEAARGNTFSNKYCINQNRLGKNMQEGRFIVAARLK